MKVGDWGIEEGLIYHFYCVKDNFMIFDYAKFLLVQGVLDILIFII
jgi:hypothetical protein